MFFRSVASTSRAASKVSGAATFSTWRASTSSARSSPFMPRGPVFKRGLGGNTNYRYFNQSAPGGKRWFNYAPKTRNLLFFLISGAGLIAVTHLEDTPVTHRKRVMTCPQWLEDKVGDITYEQVMAQYGKWVLPQDDPTTIQVKKVMNRLIDAASNYNDPDTGAAVNLFEDTKTKTVPRTDWKISVIDDVAMRQETPNAFVIGGGRVFVFRSILPLCRNDDGLATVLSHELGHNLAHHIGEKITASPLYLGAALSAYLSTGSQYLAQLIVSLCLERPASRSMESEADYIGLMVMSHACFNPYEAPRFWSRMIVFEQQNGGSVPEFVSTHPSSEHRDENLQKWMPKGVKEYGLGHCGTLPEEKKQFAEAQQPGYFSGSSPVSTRG